MVQAASSGWPVVVKQRVSPETAVNWALRAWRPRRHSCTRRVGLVQYLPDLADAADQAMALEQQFHPREEDPLATIQQVQTELLPLVGSGQGQPAVGPSRHATPRTMSPAGRERCHLRPEQANLP